MPTLEKKFLSFRLSQTGLDLCELKNIVLFKVIYETNSSAY